MTFKKNLEKIVRSFHIVDKKSFELDGRIFTIEKYDKSKNYLLDLLIQKIYEIYHCKSANQVIKISEEGVIKEFVEKLSNSNKGNFSEEEGWKIEEIKSNKQIIVSKNGLKLWVHSDQFTSSTKSIGSEGNVRFPKEFLGLLPGFYTAISQTPSKEDEPKIRFYWNVKVEGAPSLVEFITQAFNDEKIPFQFKTLKDPAQYFRTDAAVLYLEKKYFKKSLKLVLEIYNKIKPHLNSECSLFTKKIFPGLSLAEDPTDKDSFGQNRSNIIANILIENTSSASSQKNQFGVYEKLDNSGLNPEMPYLCFSKKDDYDLDTKNVR